VDEQDRPHLAEGTAEDRIISINGMVHLRAKAP
jgi:hypothetical protein